MTPAQKAMMLAEQHAVFHRQEFARIGTKHEHTEFHARSLVDCLTTLGQFNEARFYADYAPPEYGEILEAHDAACKLDDSERCSCENPTLPKIEGGIEMGTDENPRYLIDRPAIFNPYSNRLDTVYKCQFCGHANALDEHPDAASADFHNSTTLIAQSRQPAKPQRMVVWDTTKVPKDRPLHR